MAVSGHRRILITLVIAALAGCGAEQRRLTLEAAPPDLVDRNAQVELTESIGVSDRHGAVIAGAGDGAEAGAILAARGVVQTASMSGNPATILVGLALAAPAALVGGVVGASSAHPEEETEAAIAAIESVYADIDGIGPIATRLSMRLAPLGAPPVEICGPTLSPCADAPEMNDWRLITTYAFTTSGFYSPTLRVDATMVLNAASASGDTARREFRWTYLSNDIDFFEATRDDAAGLRREVGGIADALSQALINDLFLLREPTVTDGYFQGSDGVGRFKPNAAPRGLAVRVPNRHELLEQGVPVEEEA